MSAALNWRFDTRYTDLPDAFFVRLAPTPVKAPHLILFNHALAADLGLKTEGLSEEALAALFAGNAAHEGAEPFAQAYAGHQFGGFTMLGDGRAHVLGEHLTPDEKRFDVQFKGSGPTPFSRMGDGRAALGPMLREYIVSEGMHALGVRTTRSLAVVATGEPVYREDILPGAVLTRIAASHLRVGTVEYAAARNEPETLRALVHYALHRHDPDLAGAENPALALLEAVAVRQADLIVAWMRVGFIHGVMNTDNMTLSGETIDYGPCAFMEAYDPKACFSAIDRQGRYAFANQPGIALWNLSRLADALLPMIAPDQEAAIALAEPAVLAFRQRYEAGYRGTMRAKLGLTGEAGEDDADERLAAELLTAMRDAAADYTTTFRALTDAETLGEGPTDGLFADPVFDGWRARWAERLRAEPDGPNGARARMRAANPVYIPRNHLVEQALTAATEEGDLKPLHGLLDALRDPYTPRDGLEAFAAPDPQGGAGYRTFCGT